jgi:hypothetical protein
VVLLTLVIDKPTGSPNPILKDVTVPDAVVTAARTLFPESSSPHPSVASSEDILFKLQTVSETFLSDKLIPLVRNKKTIDFWIQLTQFRLL